MTKPYTDAARTAGYRIILMNFLPREFEKHMASQKVTPEKPDAHEVPEESMREHMEDFWNYNDLLDKNAKPDPRRHFNYVWDETKLIPVRSSTPVIPYDYDILITVDPNEYHTLKETIGEKALKMILEE